MQPPSDHELDLLLSRGKLRGPVAEQARERVLDAVAPAPLPRWKRLRFVVPVMAMAAASIIVVIGWRSGDSSFRAKGTGAGQPVLLGLTCSNGTAAACHRGGRVSVAFAEGASGYLGAYAEPEGGGDRIWYFSVEDGAASLTSGTGRTRLASRSVVLGAEHAAGRYRVKLVVSSRPLRRTEILDVGTADVVLRASAPLTVFDP